MNKSESIAKIASALSKAQGEIAGALKDSNNPFYKSKYADLASVMSAIRDPLSKNGLSYVQPIKISETGGMIIETILMHESGEWVSSECPVKVMKDDPQAMGSSLSYFRRYTLSALVGVAQIDDDAEANMSRPKTALPSDVSPAKITESATQSTANNLAGKLSVNTGKEGQNKAVPSKAGTKQEKVGVVVTEAPRESAPTQKEKVTVEKHLINISECRTLVSLKDYWITNMLDFGGFSKAEQEALLREKDSKKKELESA